MGLEKLSGTIFAMGMAVFVIVTGLGFLNALPFAFESVEKLVFILFLIAVIIAVEVFREEKIRNLKQLMNKPFAMLETVFIAVIVVEGFTLLAYGTIPESMKPLLGITCLLAGVVMVMELKH